MLETPLRARRQIVGARAQTSGDDRSGTRTVKPINGTSIHAALGFTLPYKDRTNTTLR